MARPPRPVALLFLGVQTLILPTFEALVLDIAMVDSILTRIPVMLLMIRLVHMFTDHAPGGE
jgi:hypothetical protein